VFTLAALPIFDDNYVWLLSAADGSAIVVDPGDAEPVLRAQAAGLDIRAILVTHHHADHVGGVEQLQARIGLPCFAPDDARIPGDLNVVRDGEALAIAGWNAPVQVIATPGHTRSHLSYVCAGHLFCGDTLFSLGCGRLFEGSPEQMHASLQRLASLPGDTLVCCTHEYSASNARFARSVDPHNLALRERERAIAEARAAGQPSLPVSLASELAFNPFLRVDRPEIRAAAEAWCGRELPLPEQVFGALRAWKDGFR